MRGVPETPTAAAPKGRLLPSEKGGVLLSVYTYIYIYIYICLYIVISINMYIYIYRERERGPY